MTINTTTRDPDFDEYVARIDKALIFETGQFSFSTWDVFVEAVLSAFRARSTEH